MPGNPERPITEAERALYKGGNGVIAEVDEGDVRYGTRAMTT